MSRERHFSHEAGMVTPVVTNVIHDEVGNTEKRRYKINWGDKILIANAANYVDPSYVLKSATPLVSELTRAHGTSIRYTPTPFAACFLYRYKRGFRLTRISA